MLKVTSWLQFMETSSRRRRQGNPARTAKTYAEFPFGVWSDCAGSIGAAAANGKATEAKAVNAHLWGRFTASFAGQEPDIKKTKAHATAQDIVDGVSTRWEQKADGHADRLAKKGAAFGVPREEEVSQYLALQGLAKQAAWYSAKIQAATADKERELREAAENQPAFRDGPEFEKPPAPGEDPPLEELVDLLASICPPCGDEGGQLCGASCLGHLVVAATVVKPEGVAEQGPETLLYCAVYGAFASEKAKLLRRRCRGKHAEGLALQRAQLKKCHFPQSGSLLRLSEPRRPTIQQRRFLDALVENAEEEEQPRPVQEDWPAIAVSPFLRRFQVLELFGLTLARLRELAKEIPPDDEEDDLEPDGWDE